LTIIGVLQPDGKRGFMVACIHGTPSGMTIAAHRGMPLFSTAQ
jgi:hypothetical protein